MHDKQYIVFYISSVKKFAYHEKFYFAFVVLYDFLVTVKAAPHECVIRTGQSQT